MKSICFNFQVHQPFRLKRYRFFQIGKDYHYYDEFENKYILNRIADKCYLPMNKLLLKLINAHKGLFKVSFSISGTAIEQFEQYRPDVLDSFIALAKTNCVEFLAETYFHSLSSLTSKEEFTKQVEMHINKIKNTLNYLPLTFRNTEMIYSDAISEIVYDMGFDTMLTEGAKHILGWKSPNYLYCSQANPRLRLLLRNFKLSDDIGFRFSNQTWNEWPLTADKFASWIENLPKEEEVVNIFLDYETFGEHQWKETGIFEFMKAIPKVLLSKKNIRFIMPYEANELLQPKAPIKVTHPISWADEERDITAWQGNDLQTDAFKKLYALEPYVIEANNPELTHVWRHLQTSDHLYYMSTKWFSAGDVHKYFNPYESPYDAYINYMNILNDLIIRLQVKRKMTTQKNNPLNMNIMKKDSENMSNEATEKKQTLIVNNSAENPFPKRKRGRPRKHDVENLIIPQKRGRKPTRQKPKVKTFTNIIDVSDNELKTYLRTLEPNTIFAAIQNSDDVIKDKILSNVSKRVLFKYEQLVEDDSEKFSEKDIASAKKILLKPFKN
jgi:alpha-amylase